MVGDIVYVGLFVVLRRGCLGGLEHMLCCLIVVGPFFGIFGPHPLVDVGSLPSSR